MNWSMPQPVLQLVAGVIGVACVGAFTLGVISAPGRGRLPGEKVGGQTGEAIQALDATPLGEERIEGPPPPKELTEEEKAKLEEEKAAKAAAAALAKADAGAATTPPAVPTPTLQAPADPVGDVPQKAPQPPPPEDPPF